MLPGQIGNLFHLAGGDIAGKDATDTAAFIVDLKHDTCGALKVHPEDHREHVNDEIHGRKVVVKQQHLVKRGRTNSGVFPLEDCSAFLGFTMTGHGVNVRGLGRFFNGQAKKPVEFVR